VTIHHEGENISASAQRRDHSHCSYVDLTAQRHLLRPQNHRDDQGLSSATAEKHQLWAICPSLPLRKSARIKGPIIFRSPDNARSFLADADILVFDGWGRSEEQNFTCRAEWLEAITRCFSPPEDEAPVFETYASIAEFVAAQKLWRKEQEARISKMPRPKRAIGIPARPGSDVYVCSLPKRVRIAQGDLIGMPLPVHKLSSENDLICGLRLAQFQPEELSPIPSRTLGEVLNLCWFDGQEDWMCCLHRNWSFSQIKRTASQSKWHRAPKYNLKIGSLRQHFWRILLEIEEAVHECHPHLCAKSLRAFWTSWQLARHLDETREEIESYSKRSGAVEGSPADIGEGITLVEHNLRSYVNDLKRIEVKDRRSSIHEVRRSERIPTAEQRQPEAKETNQAIRPALGELTKPIRHEKSAPSIVGIVNAEKMLGTEERLQVPAPERTEEIGDEISEISPTVNIERPFQRRAAWLGDRLHERAWSKHDPRLWHGPDPDTVQKILDGRPVRADVLDRLCRSLSKKFGPVTPIDIPRD
jgi:hypothetical protein